MAQQGGYLTGHVYNGQDEIPLEGASVIDLFTGRGTTTDPSGYFGLRVTASEAHIRISYIGFSHVDTLIDVKGEAKIDITLIPEPVAYDEVKVVADGRNDFTGDVRMGDVRLTRQEINALPRLLGEADPVRFLQLTPGVQSGGEGGIGFFVRGGGVDQNLVLFDGATVYNPGHLLGFVSVFNPDIISGVSLLKSGIPARFGGRLSSVIQVDPDRGRSDSLRIRGQIGVVASRVTLNRSFAADRGSFFVSARGATIDLLVKPLINQLIPESNPFLRESSYRFYDLNGGISYRLGNRDYFTLTALVGEDNYAISRNARVAETAMDWGNRIVSASWTHRFSDEMLLNTTLSHTGYHFDLTGSQSEFIFSLLSSVTDYSIQSRLDYFPGNHKFSAGYAIARHTYTPNEIDVDVGGLSLNFLNYGQLFAWEGGLFVEDEFNLGDRLAVSAGLRYTFFSQVGPYTEYLYDETSLLRDSIVYPEGESLAFYHHPEPRLSARYTLNSHTSLKASYMRLSQYVHLATSATVSLPTDIWLPSSRTIRPQTGDQLSFGYFRSSTDNRFEYSAEAYYKRSRNQVEFLRGVLASSLNLTLEENIVSGDGHAYGLELFVRKKHGKLTGWGGYTLSRAVRQFEMINNGMLYPARHDRRHDLSLAGVYNLNDRWSFSAVFVYVSGNAFTMPVGRYVVQGNLLNQYGEVNNYRMPAYHRLDLSASCTLGSRKGTVSVVDISLYNAYNRANPFYLYFRTTGDLERYRLDVEPVVVSLFPVVPAVSWRFEF
ncbi:MAG: TonB-dependent receptor [Bacteroidales bacterium]